MVNGVFEAHASAMLLLYCLCCILHFFHPRGTNTSPLDLHEQCPLSNDEGDKRNREEDLRLSFHGRKGGRCSASFLRGGRSLICTELGGPRALVILTRRQRAGEKARSRSFMGGGGLCVLDNAYLGRPQHPAIECEAFLLGVEAGAIFLVGLRRLENSLVEVGVEFGARV